MKKYKTPAARIGDIVVVGHEGKRWQGKILYAFFDKKGWTYGSEEGVEFNEDDILINLTGGDREPFHYITGTRF
jgi:hypothetical protein